MSVSLVTGTTEQNKPIPYNDSTGNGVSADISFMLQASSTSIILDPSNVTITIKYHDAEPARNVFVDGESQDNFSGNIRVIGTASGQKDNLKITFGHDAKFYSNSLVTITTAGLEDGLIPFVVEWSFKTTSFSNIYPNSSTVVGDLPPPDGTVPDNRPVDKNISFRLASAGPFILDPVPPLLPTDLLLIPIDPSIDVTISWPALGADPAYSQLVMENGIPVSDSDFIGSLFVPTDETERFPSYQFMPKRNNLPYERLITVTITQGTPTIVLPDRPSGGQQLIESPQSFSLKTTKQPLTLDEIGANALDEIQQIYTLIKDDGAETQKTYSGAGISINDQGILNDPNVDFGRNPPEGAHTGITSNDPYPGRSIRLVTPVQVVPPLYDNNRVTVITSRFEDNTNDPVHTLKLDAKGIPFTSGPVTSYTISLPVVRGSKSIQASSPGLSGMDDQAKSTTNGIFLAVQDWVRNLGAFRSVVHARDFTLPVKLLSGTFNVTNGSPTVTGVGTNCIFDLPVGSRVKFPPDPTIYTVDTSADDFQITLDANFTGTTLNGVQGLRCSADWGHSPSIESSATLLLDYINPALEICSFEPAPEEDGVGFFLEMPGTASGFSLSLKGRAVTLDPTPIAYVGWTLYYRAIANNTAISSWSSLDLEDLELTSALYNYSTSETVSFGDSFIPGTLYQCELVRKVPTATPDLTSQFYLLEVIIDFS